MSSESWSDVYMPRPRARNICFWVAVVGLLLWCGGLWTLMTEDTFFLETQDSLEEYQDMLEEFEYLSASPLLLNRTFGHPKLIKQVKEMNPTLAKVTSRVLFFPSSAILGSPDSLLSFIEFWLENDLRPETKALSKKYSGLGIVMIFPPPDTFSGLHNILVSISALREANCTLPVQVFYQAHSDTSWTPSECSLLLAKSLNVEVAPFSFSDMDEFPRDSDCWKPLAILQSTFKEVIFLESDTVALGDPSPLIEGAHKKMVNAIFWPSTKKLERAPVWGLHTTESFGNFDLSADSGQLVVIKDDIGIQALAMAAVMTMYSHDFDRWVYPSGSDGGDGAMFIHAWAIVGAQFIFAPNPAFGGFGEVCSVDSLLQHDFHGDAMFFHHPRRSFNGLAAWYAYFDEPFRCQTISEQDAGQADNDLACGFSIEDIESREEVVCKDIMLDSGVDSPLSFLLRGVAKLRDEGHEQCLDTRTTQQVENQENFFNN